MVEIKPSLQEQEVTSLSLQRQEYLINALTFRSLKKHEERKGELEVGDAHISSFADCERENIFKFLDKNFREDPKSLFFYLTGEFMHDALQDLVKSFEPEKWNIEHKIFLTIKPTKQEKELLNLKFNTVRLIGSIDMYEKFMEIPWEIKTSSAIKMDKAHDYHVNQIKTYVALTHYLGINPKKMGIIEYYLYNNSPYKITKGSEWSFYKQMPPITVTNKEVKELVAEMRQRVLKFVAAYHNKNPAIANHVMNNPKKAFKCQNCRYLKQCQEMNKTE